MLLLSIHTACVDFIQPFQTFGNRASLRRPAERPSIQTEEDELLLHPKPGAKSLHFLHDFRTLWTPISACVQKCETQQQTSAGTARIQLKLISDGHWHCVTRGKMVGVEHFAQDQFIWVEGKRVPKHSDWDQYDFFVTPVYQLDSVPLWDIWDVIKRNIKSGAKHKVGINSITFTILAFTSLKRCKKNSILIYLQLLSALCPASCFYFADLHIDWPKHRSPGTPHLWGETGNASSQSCPGRCLQTWWLCCWHGAPAFMLMKLARAESNPKFQYRRLLSATLHSLAWNLSLLCDHTQPRHISATLHSLAWSLSRLYDPTQPRLKPVPSCTMGIHPSSSF